MLPTERVHVPVRQTCTLRLQGVFQVCTPMGMKGTNRVIIYARVSTADQAENGVSLDAQIAQCRAYAALYELDVVAVVTDSASGKSLNRDGWARVASMLDQGEATGVVVAKLDRLTRSLRDLDSLLTRYFAASASLHCIAERVDTTSAAGRLCLNMLCSVAQWEREVIAERTSAALQHKKARGEKYRGPGMPAVGATAAEARALAIVRELRELGLSIRAIADELNRRCVPARGAKWHPTTVARVLKRAA